MTRNVAASVRQRLLNKAQAEGRPLSVVTSLKLRLRL